LNIPDAASGFSQEDRFPLMRFDQGNVAIGAGDGYRKSGKTGAGSDIRDAKAAGRKVGGQEQRFAVMAFDGLFKILNSGQIQNAIPPQE
jgi:hypothetical protein